MFKMGEKEFDDSPLGWCSVDDGTEEGRVEAAKLIEEFLAKVEDSPYLWFHAGQCWAFAGKDYYQQALVCFRKSAEQWHSEQARLYRLATVAFFESKPDEVKTYLKDLLEYTDPSSLVKILKSMIRQLEEDGFPDYRKMYNSL
jgi:tetratricopeptide (TPR) repeat protein